MTSILGLYLWFRPKAYSRPAYMCWENGMFTTYCPLPRCIILNIHCDLRDMHQRSQSTAIPEVNYISPFWWLPNSCTSFLEWVQCFTGIIFILTKRTLAETFKTVMAVSATTIYAFTFGVLEKPKSWSLEQGASTMHLLTTAYVKLKCTRHGTETRQRKLSPPLHIKIPQKRRKYKENRIENKACINQL
jgi:hypothetical protein